MNAETFVALACGLVCFVAGYAAGRLRSPLDAAARRIAGAYDRIAAAAERSCEATERSSAAIVAEIEANAALDDDSGDSWINDN